MGLHRREATDESSLLEVDGLANFAGERLRLSEPAVYRPRLQAIHSTVSESTIPGSGPSLAQLPYEPAAAAPFYATSSRIRAPDDDHRGFPAPVERNQVGDLGLHGYRRPPMREYDLNYTGHRRLGEMNPFFRGDAEPQGNYFREGFHISETLNDATHSRNHPADIETARPYLGQSSRADANLEAEPPLPSRYTGTPPNLQQGKLNQDRTSLRLVGRRRRVLARWLQAIGAVVVAGGALGGTFVRAPCSDRGKPPAPKKSSSRTTVRSTPTLPRRHRLQDPPRSSPCASSPSYPSAVPSISSTSATAAPARSSFSRCGWRTRNCGAEVMRTRRSTLLLIRATLLAWLVS